MKRVSQAWRRVRNTPLSLSLALLWRLVPPIVWIWVSRYLGGVSFSQHGEDEFFLNLGISNSGDSVVLIEVGAFNGLRYSPTLLLEQIFSSTTILIEPSIKNANKCRTLRKDAYTVCGAAGSSAGFEWMSGHRAVSGNSAYFSENYINRWSISESERYLAPRFRLDSLLQRLEISRVDFLSIDVQGGEEYVLQGLGASVFVKCISIELDGEHPEKDDRCRGLLRARGLAAVGVCGVNEIWVHQDVSTQPSLSKPPSNRRTGVWMRPFRT